MRVVQKEGNCKSKFELSWRPCAELSRSRFIFAIAGCLRPQEITLHALLFLPLSLFFLFLCAPFGTAIIHTTTMLRWEHTNAISERASFSSFALDLDNKSICILGKLCAETHYISLHYAGPHKQMQSDGGSTISILHFSLSLSLSISFSFFIFLSLPPPLSLSVGNSTAPLHTPLTYTCYLRGPSFFDVLLLLKHLMQSHALQPGVRKL